MKAIQRILFSLTIIAWVAAMAEVPELINYQGRLVDSGGNPVNGAVSMEINLYDAQTGGFHLYSEMQSVTVVDGIYGLQFGGLGGLFDIILNSSETWLELSIDGVPSDSRSRLLAVPYAIQASQSEDAQALATEVADLQALVDAIEIHSISLSGNLDFGTDVLVGTSPTRTLTISTTGNSPLTVTGINFPDNFSGDWPSGSIPAGGASK
jgi:hypothetical protein